MSARNPSTICLYLCLFAFVALFPITKIADFDLFFHLKLGEQVLIEKGLYRLDGFSYATEGLSQYAGEWLSNLLFFIVYEYTGFFGLGAFKSLIFLLFAFVLYRTLLFAVPEEQPYKRLLVAACVVLVSYSLRFRADLRPYLFTYLFLAAFLHAFLRSRGSGRGIYHLIPLQVIWANTHGGFVLGPLFAGLFFITEAIRQKRIPRGLLSAAVLILAASALNPEGMSRYAMLLGFASAKGGGGGLGEWQSLTPGLLWGYGLRYTIFFQMMVALSAAYIVREALNKRFDPFFISVFALSVFFSVRHVRLIAESTVLLAPLSALGIHSVFINLAGNFIRKKGESINKAGNIMLSLVVVYLSIFSVVRNDIYDFGFGPKAGVFPDAALDFLDKHDIRGNAFNTVTVGSYMIWKSPHRKTFIDGRLVPSVEADKGYDLAIKDMEGFDKLDERYNFNYAVIDYSPRSRWRYPLHLNFNPDWALLYWDENSAVYLKRIPANMPLIEEYGYKLLRPSFDDFSYLDHYIGSDPDGTIAKADADIEKAPSLQEPRLAKVYLLYYFGYKSEAFDELGAVLSMEPDTAFEHLTMAQLLLETGNTDGAVKELKQALKLDPRNEAARKLLKTIGG